MAIKPRLNQYRDFPTIAHLRRSQLIQTYGIGALLPVGTESYIMLGQEYWPSKNKLDVISEPALQRLLGVSEFRQPPAGDHPRNKMPLKRFPEWVFCPRCERLDKWRKLAWRNREGKLENVCKLCSPDGFNKDKFNLVPSRFITACANGHLEDFPYQYWVHNGYVENLDSHRLILSSDPTNDSLSGIVIECKTCGKSRSMQGALNKHELRARCHSHKPWLQFSVDQNDEKCEEPLVALQRGASNVWMPETRSSIHIDRVESVAETFVSEYFEKLKRAEQRGTDYLTGYVEDLVEDSNDPRVKQLLLDEVLQTLKDFLESEENQEYGDRQIRNEEFLAFNTEHPEETGEETFVCHVNRASAEFAQATGISTVSSVPRMREIRALVGFSRLAPQNENVSQSLLSSQRQNWLPAIQVFGEGIFLGFNAEKVMSWENSDFAKNRAKMLVEAPRGFQAPEISARKLLIHSFAHAVLNELALITGYPSSSIRERLYLDDDKIGVFLYTGTGDSAGSLGGLCAQGTLSQMELVIRQAINRARWCSADPVCSEAPPHGVDNLNLAACHYCMLAPEVSCELKNQTLDRCCLVGTPDNQQGGFFSSESDWIK